MNITNNKPCIWSKKLIYLFKTLKRGRSRTPSPTKMFQIFESSKSDREIVEAMNAMLQNQENIKELEEEKVFIAEQIETTNLKMKKLWST